MRLLQCIPALFLVTSAYASVTYTFTYAPNSGPIHAFSFSFTAPTFITEKGPFSFEPFSYTDGSNTWTMAESLAGIVETTPPAGCLYFVTAENAEIGNCTSTIFPPNSGNLLIAFPGGFPTTTGVYSSEEDINFASAAYRGFDTISFSRNTGIGTLIISGDTLVPEPDTIVLIFIGMGTLATMSPLLRASRYIDNTKTTRSS
jgi:hypothetical protein